MMTARIHQLRDMLGTYRTINRANPMMADVCDEFLKMSPAEQRELLFWMCVDNAKNATKVTEHGPGPAGTA
jgi:hypothetical protein